MSACDRHYDRPRPLSTCFSKLTCAVWFLTLLLPARNGGLEIDKRAERITLQASPGQLGEEALDSIEPKRPILACIGTRSGDGDRARRTLGCLWLPKLSRMTWTIFAGWGLRHRQFGAAHPAGTGAAAAPDVDPPAHANSAQCRREIADPGARSLDRTSRSCRRPAAAGQ